MSSALDVAHCALMVIDPQERLAPAIAGAEPALRNIDRLIRAARRLDVPVMATEQYPAGLGLLVPEILGLIDRDEVFEKETFDATRAPEVLDHLAQLGRLRPVLCGFEAHVCLAQTAMGLIDAGYSPVIVEDASGARDPNQIEPTRLRLAALGAPFVTAEMVIFEWLSRANTPAFRDLLPVLK